MGSRRATSLYFCDECGSLKLRDVKDQLQKLFTEIGLSIIPNVCGICQQGVDHLNTTAAQCKEEDTQGEELVISKKVNDTRIELGNVKRLKNNCETANKVKNKPDRSNTNTLQICKGDVDKESNQTSGHRVTRVSTGAVEVQHYPNTSSNIGSDDDADYDEEEYDVKSDSDGNQVDETIQDLTSDLQQDNIKPVSKTPSENTKVKIPLNGTGTDGLDPELLQLMIPSDDPMRPFKCKFCDVSPFKMLLRFQRHVKSHTGKKPMKKPYKCDVCEKSFVGQVRLLQHQQVHTRSKLYKCTVDGCEFSYGSKDDLKSHLSVHRGIPFHCETCGLGFRFKRVLTAHQTIHSDARPFACKYCNKTFSKKNQCSKHQRSHVKTTKYKCDTCTYTCLQESTLEKHKRTHISNLDADIDIGDITRWIDPRVVAMMDKPTSIDTPFKCKLCDSRDWKTPNLLIRHVAEFHSQESLITQPFLCDLCDKRFDTESNLQFHYMDHTGKRPFKCHHTGCNKTFKNKSLVKSHQNYVHNVKCFICSSCGKQFVTTSKLKAHENRVHLKLRPYICEQCGKTYPAKSLRDYHIKRAHSTDKPFICETCGRCFAIKEDLTCHIYLHTGEKRYSCDFCDYRCARADYLKKHRRIHTGEKRHPCKYCGMNFFQTAALVLHLEKHSASDIEMFIFPQKPDEVVATNEVVTTCTDLPSSQDEIRNATYNIAMNLDI